MSSFDHPHFLYLFAMKSGWRKLAYGGSPAEAYENLKLRLTPAEMEAIFPDQYQKITQREIRGHLHELG